MSKKVSNPPPPASGRPPWITEGDRRGGTKPPPTEHVRPKSPPPPPAPRKSISAMEICIVQPMCGTYAQEYFKMNTIYKQQLPNENEMNLHQFVPLAVRTESVPAEFKAPRFLLVEALKAYIAAGNMLDQIKKHAFYGSDFDLPKYQYTLRQLSDQLLASANSIAYLDQISNDSKDYYDTTFPAVQPRLAHSLIGAVTESTELAQALLKYLETGEVDLINVSEEFADTFWYYAIFIDHSGIDPMMPLENVINKLKARYPDKFSQLNAENRDLENERTILSNGIKTVD